MNEYPTIGMQTGILDILIKQGDTSETVLSFRDDLNNPMSLSGYTIKMDIKVSENVKSPAVLSKTIGNGLSVSGHVLTINFGDETLYLGLEVYYYDILFISGAKKNRWVSGKLLIDKSVTK